ncbi:hypothetical protein WH47_04786 [Habropoda laboriosa]|uniref:Uncharacterized protein n=2 Tax=Habropoda laboriosa TaxID=597456 RepID=A0A0L7QXL0_9HYME|nr:hypothetical protein WH47_04786 [Habropoda laboriosa]
MPSVGVKYSTRRFSKPTKIVSRSPKLKLRSKKSKASTIEYFPYVNTKLKQPIVLLQRLPNIVTIMPSSLPVSSSMVKIRINDRFGDNNINVSRKIFNFAFDHPRQLLKMSNKPGKRHTRSKNYSNDEQNETLYKLQENTGTRLREKSLSGKMMLMHECGDASQTSSGSLISSTPKDKEILNEPGKKCKRRKMSPEWDTTSKLNKCSTRSSQNDNVTVTMEDEQEGMKIKNETYELIEPKTPNLRKRLQEKRDVEENNLNQKSAKKNVKIRFTSSSSNRNSNYNTRSGGRLNKKDRSDDDLKNITSTASLKKNILKSRISVFRRRSRSNSGQVIPTVDPFTPSQIGRKSTTSVVNVNIATPPQQFMSRQNTKWLSATKKVPNFANIHNKIFTKSESIADAKNRLKDRHTAFTTSRINKSTKGEINLNEEGDQLSKGSNKETYNRFGFKMRKRKATDCILRNSSSHSARCKEQCRAILKGVRTNRRFELQMKLRNVNL